MTWVLVPYSARFSVHCAIIQLLGVQVHGRSMSQVLIKTIWAEVLRIVTVMNYQCFGPGPSQPQKSMYTLVEHGIVTFSALRFGCTKATCYTPPIQQ